jgi:RNA polymerase sigma-70 factor (sigma-E family)
MGFSRIEGVMTTDDGFDTFMSERQRPLLRFAMVLTGDGRLAEEIVADVLSRAWEHWDRIAGLDAPNAYVRRMIVNEFVSWRRRLRRTSPHADLVALVDESSTSAGPDPASAHADRDALIGQLRRLPRKQRAVVVLRFYVGLSDAEIAETLDCAAGTVRSNASRALSTLRINLQDNLIDAGAPPRARFVIEES